MTTIRKNDREKPDSSSTGWRNSRALDLIRRNIRAAVSEDPSVADQFMRQVDSNPPVSPIVKRAQSGEFAAKAIEERYGPEVVANAKAITGGAD
jgi:hypothetical protein